MHIVVQPHVHSVGLKQRDEERSDRSLRGKQKKGGLQVQIGHKKNKIQVKKYLPFDRGQIHIHNPSSYRHTSLKVVGAMVLW